MLKILLKKRRHFSNFFYISICKYFIVVIIDIYLCKKHCHLLCWVYKKIILFSLFTPQFFIQKFISILHVKWTGMNMWKAGWKLEVLSEHTFWMTQSLFAATKINILIFNLTHYLISLMGSFHFPQWKIFFPLHWPNSWNFTEKNISIVYFRVWNVIILFYLNSPSYFQQWSLN